MSTRTTSMTPAKGFRPLLVLPLLVAALPALLILQTLPRLVDLQANPNAATALGLGELVIPVAAAAIAGVLAAMLHASGRFALLAGAAAQIAALPALLDITGTMVQAAFIADAAFWVALFLSHVVLSAGAAYYARRWWAGPTTSTPHTSLTIAPATGMLLLGAFFLGWLLALAYVGAGAWQHLLSLAAAAAVLSATVVSRSEGAARSLGWTLLIATAGIAAFTIAVEVSLMLNPPPILPDPSQFDIPAGS